LTKDITNIGSSSKSKSSSLLPYRNHSFIFYLTSICKIYGLNFV